MQSGAAEELLSEPSVQPGSAVKQIQIPMKNSRTVRKVRDESPATKRVIKISKDKRTMENTERKLSDSSKVTEKDSRTHHRRSLHSYSDDLSGSERVGVPGSAPSSSPEELQLMRQTPKSSATGDTMSPIQHSIHLYTSIGDRLSNHHYSSGSGTDEEEIQKCQTTGLCEVIPGEDTRLCRLKELFKMESKRLEKLQNISGALRMMQVSLERPSPANKRAQEIVENLTKIQNEYVSQLQKRLNTSFDGNTTIADVFQCLPARHEALLEYRFLSQTLMDQCKLLPSKDYSGGHKKSLRKTKGKDDGRSWIRHQIQSPLSWIEPTLKNIKLFIGLTPITHPDGKELENLVHKMTNSSQSSRAICLIGDDQLDKPIRTLKVHSLVVELENTHSNERKLRYLLLFSDVLVCAKIRIIRKDRNRPFFGEGANKPRLADRLLLRPNQNAAAAEFAVYYPNASDEQQQARLETKWFIPLDQLVLGANTRVADDQRKIAERLDRLNEIKEKISKIRLERKLAEQGNRRQRIGRSIPYLTKIEGELALQTPQLVLPIGTSQGPMHHILLVTEREREQWRAAIDTQKKIHQTSISQTESLCEKVSNAGTIDPNASFATVVRMEPKLSEINELLKYYSQRDLRMVQLNKTGIALLKKNQGVTGILKVTVHKVEGLTEVDSYHVCIEVDSYGQYEEVARTRVVTQYANPEWNQSFDVQVDEAHQICFTVYRHCDFVGYYELLLEGNQLTYNNAVRPIETNESDAPSITLTFSLAFNYKSQARKNIVPQKEGVFKRSLKTIIEFDKTMIDNTEISSNNHLIPRIVTACIDEIERRGLREVGLYRVCGANSDINTLVTLFNQDQEQAIKRLPTVEIAVIASVLKLFFRDLPEPLLTDEGSISLMRAADIPDENTRIEAIYDSLRQLPLINGETFKCLATHLITVARYRETNMMDLGNLALIWSTALFQSASETVRRHQGTLKPTEAANTDYVSSLNREAAVGFQQTKTLAVLLTAIQNGKMSWPSFPKDIA